MTRKEREREFRKTEILSAAKNLFAEKGYNSTTLDEIAEASEFGKGTLYNYFLSKEEIYSEIIEEILETFLNELKSIDKKTQNFKEFLEEMTRFLIGYCLRNRASFIILVQKRMNVINEDPESITNKMRDLFKDIQAIQIKRIKRAISNREIKNVEPQRLAILIRSVIFYYVYNFVSCRKDEIIDIEQETSFTISIILNGILNN